MDAAPHIHLATEPVTVLRSAEPLVCLEFGEFTNHNVWDTTSLDKDEPEARRGFMGERLHCLYPRLIRSADQHITTSAAIHFPRAHYGPAIKRRLDVIAV